MSRSGSIHLQLFVNRLMVRSHLSAGEQQAILALPASEVVLAARQDFVRLNEVPSYSSLVVSGMIGRFAQTSNGVRQFTALHIPGDMADLPTAVRPVGIGGLGAICETSTLRIPHAALRKLAAQFPPIAEAFWRECALDTAVLLDWVVNIGRRDARARLAHLLCEMAIRFGSDRNPQLDYTFPVTQEQLGDATALTSVHVNRSLRSLREQGLATVRLRGVQIHDWAGLVRAGEFDPTYLSADMLAPRKKPLQTIE